MTPRVDAGRTRFRYVVLGTGRMGRGIAAAAAAAGQEVHLVGRTHARAEATAQSLSAVRNAARVSAGGFDRDLRTGTPNSSLPTIVVESVVEDPQVKIDVLNAARASFGGEAVYATNTSSLDLTVLAGGLDDATRFVGMHFFNPAETSPLVELVLQELASPDALGVAREAITSLDKQVLLVREPVPGFVWNRIQFAVLREALYLTRRGVCTAEDIDEVLELCLGPRWTVTGPFASADLGGSALFADIAQRLFRHLAVGDDALADELRRRPIGENVLRHADEAVAARNYMFDLARGFHRPWRPERNPG